MKLYGCYTIYFTHYCVRIKALYPITDLLDSNTSASNN